MPIARRNWIWVAAALAFSASWTSAGSLESSSFKVGVGKRTRGTASASFKVVRKRGRSFAAGGSAAGTSESGVPFALGEHYFFPNPAKGVRPTLHVEAGSAEGLDIRIYDVSGALVHKTSIDGGSGIVEDRYAYEYGWDTSHVGSGVYVYVAVARKANHPELKAMGKVAVIK